MVVLQIKIGDLDGFLYETACAIQNDALVRELVHIYNLRIRLRQLSGAIRYMAAHGPMKNPQKAGIDEIQEKYNGEYVEKGEFYNPDPTGMRTGNGVGPQLSETIETVAREVEGILDKVGYLHQFFCFPVVTRSFVPRIWSSERFPQRLRVYKRNWT